MPGYEKVQQQTFTGFWNIAGNSLTFGLLEYIKMWYKFTKYIMQRTNDDEDDDNDDDNIIMTFSYNCKEFCNDDKWHENCDYLAT